MANFSFSSSPPFLLLFTFSFLFVVSSGQGLEAFNTSCPNPEGVVAPDVVEIGVLVTPQGASIDSSVFLVALDLINEDRCLLPDTRLNITFGYDHGRAVDGLDAFFTIQDSINPVGWVGPTFSSVARPIALASPLYEVPTVADLATSADLSDEGVYPYFSRVVASDQDQGRLLADLCSYYNWDRVATVSATDAYGSSIIAEFRKQAVKYSISFLSSSTFPPERNANSEEDYLMQVRSAVRKTKQSGARIILLSCFSNEAADFISMAIQEGIFGPPYTYLIADAITTEEIARELEDDDDTLQQFNDNIRGMIGLKTQGIQDSPFADEWRDAWINADTNLPGGGDERVAEVTAYALQRDALYIMGWAIDRMVRRGEDPSDGPALLKSIQQETDFMGLTGRVELKPNGDRYATYEIVNTQDEDSYRMRKIGNADALGLDFNREAVFSDGTTNVPDAAERVFVDWGDIEAIVMLSLFSIGIVVALVCLVVMMSHRGTPIMRYSSPRFVCGIVIGVLFGFMNVFVWTGAPSSSKCLARPWLLMLNFVLIFGCLYAKAFRFLFVMKQRKKLQFRPIPDLHLFGCVFCYLLLFSIPCIVWTAAYPLDVVRKDNNPDNDKVNIVCDGENSGAFLGVLLALGGVSLVVGVIVAFLNRGYHDFFSESTYIGYTLFTVCVTCCVVLPMLFILDDTPDAFYIVLMLGVFLSNAAVLVFLFFPKIYVIFIPGKNVLPVSESGALKTKKNTPSS